MIKDIKVLILDIDGTIAGVSNNVRPKVREAIAKIQAKGIKVGLATGRMYCSALKFHEQIGADLPIIGYNGAWMQNPVNEEMLLHQPLQPDIALELVNYFREHKKQTDLEVHLYFEDQLYVEEFTPRTKIYVERSGIDVNVIDDFTTLLNNHTTKILALSDDSQLIGQLLTDLRQRYDERQLYLTQSSPVYLEATSAGVNKGESVKYLIEKILGLSSQNVMTMGDNFNDYAMLEYAGFSVAMGCAPEAVKQIADAVTTTVEEDGVATAIEKFLF